jgi:hypothetical protein
MSPRTFRGFRLDDELREGLRLVKERDGIPESEQVRRAIRRWLVDADALPKEKPKPRPSKR